MEIRTLLISVFSVAGFLLGIISHFVSVATGMPELNLAIVCIALYSLKILLSKKFSLEQPLRWWFSNGVAHALMVWFVVWTILYNLLVVKQF